MDWSIFLFALKWVLLGLVYLVLILLLIGVQREMRLRLPQPGQGPAAFTFGRMRVIRPGADPRLRPGAIVHLQPEMNIGALADNDLVLRDRYVSGHHARLRWDGVNWWVEDQASTNGTFLNQQRLAPGTPTSLIGGAILDIGDISFEMLD